MLFNSVSFAIFLPVVFLLYWFVAGKKVQHQNILLLVASYFFYACWDWRFLFLLLFSTALDYFSALKIEGESNAASRKIWLWISISINLGFLAVFKYYNFFAASFQEAASGLGLSVHPAILTVILPVGISFYTFHGLSYIIDCYYNRIKAERNFTDYAVFVSFFPLLVAGPIERATHLLPQIKAPRTFNYSNAVNGLRQILWGLFKKVVIADNCAEYTNLIFDSSSTQPGSTLVMGAVFFAFQIYGDFSGYSDIAIGTARLFGIELIRNFAFPYFSRDIAEFWRRWHISLSSWFRDYVYIPLGGSRNGKLISVRNTFIIFILSGFWHGANWTFICWGLLHALYFLPLLLTNRNRSNMSIAAQHSTLPTFKELLQMLFTFALVCFAWIFFRANDVTHALQYISGIFSKSVFELPFFEEKKKLCITLFLMLVFIIIEWKGRRQQYAIEVMGNTQKRPVRIAMYYALIIVLFLFSGKGQQFIYFQF
jgi:alginate O-acetyltransferase complex protein AlgI